MCGRTPPRATGKDHYTRGKRVGGTGGDRSSLGGLRVPYVPVGLPPYTVGTVPVEKMTIRRSCPPTSHAVLPGKVPTWEGTVFWTLRNHVSPVCVQLECRSRTTRFRVLLKKQNYRQRRPCRRQGTVEERAVGALCTAYDNTCSSSFLSVHVSGSKRGAL